MTGVISGVISTKVSLLEKQLFLSKKKQKEVKF